VVSVACVFLHMLRRTVKSNDIFIGVNGEHIYATAKPHCCRTTYRLPSCVSLFCFFSAASALLIDWLAD
jgi:hypothetical protein